MIYTKPVIIVLLFLSSLIRVSQYKCMYQTFRSIEIDIANHWSFSTIKIQHRQQSVVRIVISSIMHSQPYIVTNILLNTDSVNTHAFSSMEFLTCRWFEIRLAASKKKDRSIERWFVNDSIMQKSTTLQPKLNHSSK